MEAHDTFGVRHKIRKRVDVVIEQTPVSIVDYVFDAAYFDACFLHDAFHILNHLPRRSVAFHLKTILGGIDRASGPCQLLSPGALANIRGAKVESIAGSVNLNRVEKLAAQHL